MPSASALSLGLRSAIEDAKDEILHDDPHYYAHTPRDLISTSTVDSFLTGTGDRIYKSLLPILESTNHELILVTCFWARSSTLDTINSLLIKLSNKAVRRGTSKIRVRICFSSLSLFQKLFHTQDAAGQHYPPESWPTKLGLPPKSSLGGLELTVKSVFMLPFSVMHPKFIIVDRERVILPSCNVSWEEWFEAAITLSGPIVLQFLKFYAAFWVRREGLTTIPRSPSVSGPTATADRVRRSSLESYLARADEATSLSESPARSHSGNRIPTILLPSAHHRNPRFQLFSGQNKVVAPKTPLNMFLLNLFEQAQRDIRIQTPNLTSPPVLSALLAALARGVNVQILTSESLMTLEQLVTAGTTTPRCMRKLIARYKALRSNRSLTGQRSRPADEETALAPDDEAKRPGRLKILYFAPKNGPKRRGEENGEPQQSHLKMTIVDSEVLVLGSGNLDRASWFTSQEVGVAFCDAGIAQHVGGMVDVEMVGRTKLVCDLGEG